MSFGGTAIGVHKRFDRCRGRRHLPESHADRLPGGNRRGCRDRRIQPVANLALRTADVPVFDGGARKAKVKLAESEAGEQYLAWNKSVLNGAQKVENALAA